MTWSPLEHIAYGFCIFPFCPADVDQPTNEKSNPHQIQLETGDEIYAFEQIREAGQPIWYRGYVVSTSRYPSLSNSATQVQSMPTTVEEPQVSIGIFPSTHVRIRQMLPDAEGRLASTYLSFQSTLKQFPQRSNTATITKSPSFGKMETLEEEEEEEDVEKRSLTLNDNDYTHIDHKLNKNNKMLPDNRPPPPLPSLKCGDETSFGHNEPLIDEIACALREYFTALHSSLTNKDYILFDKIKNNINALNYARMQLLQQSSSTDSNSYDDLIDLRARAVERLVKANVDLGLDVIVRHPTTGALANISKDGEDIDKRAWISSIRMYAQQVELAYINSPGKSSGAPISQPSLEPLHKPKSLSNLTEPLSLSRNNRPSTVNQQGQSASSASDSSEFYHVYLNLRSFNASPCYVGETVELFFSLYSANQGRFLTEDHVVVLDHNGLPTNRNGDFVCTLFRDLSKVDVSDSLYLVCKIIRNGFLKSPLNFEDTAGASTKKFLRRPFGCAVLNLGQLSAKSNKDMNEAVQYSIPIYVPSMNSGVAAENLFANLHQDIITNNVKVFDASTRATDISVTVKSFHGAFNQMLRDHSGVLLNVPTTARLGFSDAVFPADIRNDLYCKLWSGDFTSTLASSTSRLSLLSNTNSNTSKNIQVTVEARRKDGSRIENCFTGGTGDKVQSVWDFTVFANNSQPTWGEMVKLTNVSAQEFLDIHLFFTIRNKSTKDKEGFNVSRERLKDQEKDDSFFEPPFAWGYLPIFNEGQAFLPDASHTLQLFKCFGEIPSASLYLNNTTPTIPQGGKKERVFSGGSLHGNVNGSPFVSSPEGLSSPGSPSEIPRLRPLRDSISIRTFLCSTLFTQNAVLLKLLSWERERSYQTQSATDIESILSQLPFVGEPEIVKFLAETFDAIFGIMASSANEGDRFDPLLFNALVKVLAIIQDRRFSQFETVLDVYINENFTCGPASSHLMRSLQRLLAKPSDPSTAQQLHAALKVLPFLIRFIVRSREIQREKSAGLDVTSGHLEDSFKKELIGVLNGLVKLMEMSTPSSVIGTQTLALRHFAGCLPELEKIFPSEELVEHVMAFAEACKATKGKLVVYILLNYLHIVRSGLFDKPGTRTILVPTLIRLVKPHLGPYDEYQHVKSKDPDNVRDAARVGWIERLRLSVTILATMLDKLHVAIVDPAISASRTLSRQEQDNVEDIMSLLPRLLESYHELNSDALIDAISKHNSPSTTIASIPTVYPATYPFSLLSELPQSLISTNSKSTKTSLSLARNSHFNCGLGEIASVILVIIQLLPKKRILDFIQEYAEIEGERNLTRFLTNIFSFSIGVLDHKDSGIDEKLIPCPYPQSWLNISLFAHRMVLKFGEAVSVVMERQYVPSLDLASEFNRNLWRVCFEMFIRLLASNQLIIEEQTPQKRRVVWKLAGDLRGEGAQTFSRLWNAIGWPNSSPNSSNDNSSGSTRYGGFQIQFPDLVADLLELCLSHHDELRNQAVGILHSMIVSEHHLHGHFEGIEAEIIDKVDKLFMDGTKGDEISRAFFVSELRSSFDSPAIDEKLRKDVSRFLDSVDYFLDLLLSIRNLPVGEEFEDDRLEATLKLMTFIRNLREEIYVKYLHALVHMHLRSHAYAEAGMTLKLHADMYTWDSSSVLEPLADLNLPKQTQFQRRETLLAHCMEYLAAGKAFEVAVEVCKDLAYQYENKTYDYHKLADILTYQASLVDSIMKGDREFPEHFRVAYHGGFPPALKNKQFVYRGMNHEHIDAFCIRMQEKHPSAQILSGSQNISQDTVEAYEQYLSITTVTPEVDRTSPIIQNPYVAEPIRKYYENNTDLFSYTHSLDKDCASSSVSLEGEWMEKTLLQCESQFPSVLRRSEIIETRTVEVSPIDLALEEVEMMRQEMAVVNSKFGAQLESRHNKKNQSQQNLRVEALSMVLNNACDIPVDAGVSYYRSTYLARKDDNASSQRLEKSLINLALTIRRGLDIHKLMCTSEMARFHMTLEKLFVKNYSKEIAQFPSEMMNDANGEFSRSSSFKSFGDKQKRNRNLSTLTNSSSVNTNKSSKHTLSLPKLSSLRSMSKQRSSPSLDYNPTSPKSPTSSVKSWTPRLHRSKSKTDGPPQLSLGKFDEEGFSRLFSRK